MIRTFICMICTSQVSQVGINVERAFTGTIDYIIVFIGLQKHLEY